LAVNNFVATSNRWKSWQPKQQEFSVSIEVSKDIVPFQQGYPT